MNILRPLAALIGLFIISAGSAAASDPSKALPSPTASPSPKPTRPQINWLNRDKEDWSVLADPALRTDRFDSIKYMPLGKDPLHYLSLGITVRELPETQSFQVGDSTPQTYLLSRIQIHADLRLGDTLRIFTQLASYFAPWKNPLTPVDQDPLAIEQAFVGLHFPESRGTFDVQVGRQELPFGLQRFLADREGPNVRQPFDAVWSQYHTGDWYFQGLYSQPVQTQTERAFGDYSTSHYTFSGLRISHDGEVGQVSAYAAQLVNDNAVYLFASGAERRDVLDLRAAGATHGNDFDVEGMYQSGYVGEKVIRAWGGGSSWGYTWKTARWSPRVGLQFDAASGDAEPAGKALGTFNPLFPNGLYMALAATITLRSMERSRPTCRSCAPTWVRTITPYGLHPRMARITVRPPRV